MSSSSPTGSRLAASGALKSGMKTIFGRGEERAHDRNLVGLVQKHLKHPRRGLDVSVTGEATRTSIRHMRAGEDTISVAGDVLGNCNAVLFSRAG